MIRSWMDKNLNIRKRLLVFGCLWLFLCTSALTIYLVFTARHALIESAVQRSYLLTHNLAQQARSAVYSGNKEAIEVVLNNVRSLPDVLEARIEYPSNGPNFPKPRSPQSSRMLNVSGKRAIESHVSISTQINSGFDLPFRKTNSNPEESPMAVVLISVEPIYAHIDQLVLEAILILSVVLLVGLFLGWLISGKMVSPLRRLAAHVQSMAQETTHGHKYNGSSNDEIKSINNGLMLLKNKLDNTTAELAHLHYRLEDRVREQTADLERRNDELGKILAIKNDLIVQLTHEMNTPLYALENHLRFVSASAKGLLKPEPTDRLERTLALCERLRRMVTVILEFAVRESGKIQMKRERVIVADIAAQVAFSLEALAEQKNVRCMVDESVLEKVSFADPDHVEQILLNLMKNAIKASPADGIIRIEAREQASSIEIRVVDHGSGIPPSLQDKLFREKVVPKMEGGHGVGLYISRCLVELQGGQIRFESDPNIGTTLFFTLPKYPASGNIKHLVPVHKEIPGGSTESREEPS